MSYVDDTLATANKALAGKKIIRIRYMAAEEADASGWERRAPVIEVEGGQFLFPSTDDEGNDAGALFTGIKGAETIGVIR